VVEEAEKMDALLVNLVLLFKNAAMQQMGKIINPVTGKVEKNLEQARFSVDMLEMLKEKTRGNISGDLERLLDSTLLEVRMNYVEEAEASAREEAAAEGEAATHEATTTGEEQDAVEEGEGSAGQKTSGKGKKGRKRGKKA
jgi:hypothetical protein